MASYCARSGVMSQTLEGETIVLDANSGTYFRLNEVGTLVWAGIEAGTCVDDIVDGIAGQYGMPRDEVRADVDAMLSDLLDRELISSTS